jgi:hypothetical protein
MKPYKHKIPVQKHINAIGIEFEGGWAKFIHKNGRAGKFGELGIHTKRKRAPQALKYDGSVRINVPEATWKGEIASKPLQIRNIRAWITRNRPEIIDPSCGTHVHVSVVDANKYTQLTDKAFETEYLSRMAKWGSKNEVPKASEFWKRLQGKNSYCRKEHVPENQMYFEGRGGHRYTQINYCYGLWKTVEFRMLPAFDDPWLTTDSILETCRIVEDFLDVAPPLKNYWKAEQEYETPETKSVVYEETASFHQINEYKKKRQHFDEEGWISRRNLKITGKTKPLEEYVVTEKQAYLVPENVPKGTTVITPSRYRREMHPQPGAEEFYEIYQPEEEE